MPIVAVAVIAVLFLIVTSLASMAVGVLLTYLLMRHSIENTMKVAKALVKITEKEANVILALEATKMMRRENNLPVETELQ